MGGAATGATEEGAGGATEEGAGGGTCGGFSETAPVANATASAIAATSISGTIGETSTAPGEGAPSSGAGADDRVSPLDIHAGWVASLPRPRPSEGASGGAAWVGAGGSESKRLRLVPPSLLLGSS